MLRTCVAHGANTGELYAEQFSNREGSHQSSLGLYRVGAEIAEPQARCRPPASWPGPRRERQGA